MRKMMLTLTALFAATAAFAGGDLEVTGFADASYVLDTAADNGEFGLDQFELDVVHRASDKTFVRADLEWVKDGEDMLAQVEQAFMTYTCNAGWDFTFGKFNAPIGFELLDAPDMYQFSHALVFDHGLPTNMTGAAAARAFGDGFDIVGYVANGWDRNAGAGANATFGTRLGYGRDAFSGGASLLSGKEDVQNSSDRLKRTVFDIDAGYTRGAWLFGFEYNQGKATEYEGARETESEWSGFLLMTHYDHSDRVGFTFRYDRFDDKDGYVWRRVGGEVQKRQAFTFCPTFVMDDNLGALIEVRMDKSDQDAFRDKDGDPADTSTTVAFEMTYSW